MSRGKVKRGKSRWDRPAWRETMRYAKPQGKDTAGTRNHRATHKWLEDVMASPHVHIVKTGWFPMEPEKCP